MHNRNFLSVLFAAALVIGAIGTSATGHAAESDSKYKAMLEHERVPGEFIVGLDGTKLRGLMNTIFSADLGIQSFEVFQENSELVEVKIADDAKAEIFLKKMNAHPAVRYAEPNYIVRLAVNDGISPLLLPNEPDFGLLWGLENTGQEDVLGYPGRVGADIGVRQAWDIRTKSAGVLVAVLDSGVHYYHRDLVYNMSLNGGELGLDANGNNKRTNNIDDDQNKYIDDLRGWNFIAGEAPNRPLDGSGHGTHVAGIIGADGNNGVGVTGVAWTASIVPIKVVNNSGTGSLVNLIKGTYYASTRGVHIINASLSFESYSDAMYETIRYARDEGILFVAAAGNSGNNNDASPIYPSSYGLDNIIAVAATNNNDLLAGWSNYGLTTVDIAAPGEHILSTYVHGQYRTLSGTSMAAPYVAGAAALIWSEYPGETYTQIRNRILDNCDGSLNPRLATQVSCGGRLDVGAAIQP